MIDFACKKFEMNEVIKCTLGLTKSEYKLMDFFLEKEDKWVSTSKLSNLFELNITTIQRAVKTLYEKDILDRRQDNLEQGGYEYYYKISLIRSYEI